MGGDREIGEFLEERLQFSWIPNSYAYLCEDWIWTGRIIEAMQLRGFYLSGGDQEDFKDGAWEFCTEGSSGLIVTGKFSPRTVALAAAKALGMEVGDE